MQRKRRTKGTEEGERESCKEKENKGDGGGGGGGQTNWKHKSVPFVRTSFMRQMEQLSSVELLDMIATTKIIKNMLTQNGLSKNGLSHTPRAMAKKQCDNALPNTS